MIMMSQNRKADRDRIEAHIDYEINLKAETEIKAILENLDAQNIVIAELHQMLEELHNNKTDKEMNVQPEDPPDQKPVT